MTWTDFPLVVKAIRILAISHYVRQHAAAHFGQPEPQIQQLWLSQTSKPGWSVSGKRMFLFCGVVWPEMPPQERQTNETGKCKDKLVNLEKAQWKHAILMITLFSDIFSSRQPGREASPRFNWSHLGKHNSASLCLATFRINVSFSEQLPSKIVNTRFG